MSNQDDLDTGSDGSDSIYRAPSSETAFAPQGDLLATYVGPKNGDYYARQFEQFKTRGNLVSWNWPAFLVTSIWLLYRKMWLYALAYWLLLPIALVLASIFLELIVGAGASGVFYNIGYIAINFVLIPIFANRLYYRHAQKKVDKVAGITSSAEQQAVELARIGGTSNVILVVIPIFLVAFIGILAAIAIPAYQDYTIRAQVSEGLNLSGSAKAAVAEYYLSSRELPFDNESAGLLPAEGISGLYVTSVAVSRGDVTVTYGNRAHALIAGDTLVLTPSPQSGDTLRWDCSSPSIAAKHLPAACR